MRCASALFASVVLAMTISATPMQRRQDDDSVSLDPSITDFSDLWDLTPDPVYSALPLAVASAKPSVNSAAVAASISAEIAASTIVLASAEPTASPERRAIRQQLAKRTSSTSEVDTGSVCSTPEKTGSYTGYVPETDAAGFVNFANFHSIAQAAGGSPPSGYSTTFSDQNGASLVPAGAWYNLLPLSDYSTSTCASACDADARCNGFNTYFERDPKYTVTDDKCTGPSCCPNPKAVTNSKCVLLGYSPDVSNAVNNGQWQNQFHVVIAGSNGYSKTAGTNTVNLLGYQAGHALGKCIPKAQTDGAFMGAKTFPGSTDFNNCAVACNTVVGRTVNGVKRTCAYFVAAPTYNAQSVYQGLTCALYTTDQSYDEGGSRNSDTTNCGDSKVNYKNAASYLINGYVAPQ